MSNSWPTVGLLDPRIEQYMQQQRQQEWWGRVAQGGFELLRQAQAGGNFGQMAGGLLQGMGQPQRGGGLLKEIQIQNAIDARDKKYNEESRYATMVGGLDPKTGIDWKTGRVQGQAPATQIASSGAVPGAPGGGPLARTVPGQLGFTPEQQGLLRGMGPERGMGILEDRAFALPKAPTVREFKEGNRIITKRWQPSTRSWEPVGAAPRFKPGEGGGLTQAQIANNAEIDEARARLAEMEQNLEPGVSLADDIHRRISVTDPTTGRLTPDYNSFLGRTAWAAMQRKVGEDQDQARWSRLLVNPPEFSDPAGAKQLSPGVSAEEPNPFQRGYNYLFGGDTSQNQLIPPDRRAVPRISQDAAGSRPVAPRGRLGRGRSTKGRPIQRMSVTEIDDLVSARGDSLSPAELRAIQARLTALGR